MISSSNLPLRATKVYLLPKLECFQDNQDLTVSFLKFLLRNPLPLEQMSNSWQNSQKLSPFAIPVVNKHISIVINSWKLAFTKISNFSAMPANSKFENGQETTILKLNMPMFANLFKVKWQPCTHRKDTHLSFHSKQTVLCTCPP